GAVINPVQLLVLVIGSGLYTLWASALVVAAQGSRPAMAATLPLCAVGALGNGLSIVAGPPPCGGAAPIGDIVHIGCRTAVRRGACRRCRIRAGRDSRRRVGDPAPPAPGRMAYQLV